MFVSYFFVKFMAKKKCPECESRFEYNEAELDVGDFFECPECSFEFVVEANGDKIKLVPSREKEIDELDEEVFESDFD